MILDQIKEKGNLNQILYSEIVYTHPQSLPSSKSGLLSCFKLLEALFYALLVPGITNSVISPGLCSSEEDVKRDLAFLLCLISKMNQHYFIEEPLMFSSNLCLVKEGKEYLLKRRQRKCKKR